MYRFNRKAKQEVTKKPKPTDGNNKNTRTSSTSSAASTTSSVASIHQKRTEPKSESDSKSEKSLNNAQRKRIEPSPVQTQKMTSPDRDKKLKSMGKIVKGVVTRMPFTPNKTPNRKQQKSTSTPPTSENRRKVPISDLSDRVDSETEIVSKPKQLGSLSNSLSGSNETLASDALKNQNNNKMAAKMVKSDRSLIGLDGETETDMPKNGRRSLRRRSRSSDSPSSRREKSQEESASETKDSISLADDEEQREAYRKLFKEFAMESQKLTLDDFKNEFNLLPGDPPSEQCSEFHLAVNNKKNRYYNIPCLDSSRVRLTFMANKNSPDYIHANYIRSPFLKREYILTQGPKKETIADFWRMVWQEKSTAIVMLCQFVETNREKCVEYFPRNANCSLRFDKLILTYEDSTVNKSMVTTRLSLFYEGETRSITHLQWKEWPDYQVPGSSEVMLKILRKIRARSTPPVIHCAAGVGRSGTLMAVEIALQSINSHFKLPNIKQIVSELRLTGRATSVQTLQQYMLIWKVLLDFGVSNKLIPEDLITKFSYTYRRSFRNHNQS
uniref:Protein-tyrosine phosphatase n=1 Tax=Caenorhabditis tropicalis TaxID=1561998 RepID=A0A1I7UHX1_9PELO